MRFKIKIFSAVLIILSCGVFFTSCDKAEPVEDAYVYSKFILGVQSKITVFGSNEKEAKHIADTIFAEWRRISKDFSFTQPYSYISDINTHAYSKPVKINAELYGLLRQSVEYYNLTDGAFDITFAPLWPIWKKAASTKKLPLDEDIKKAISNIGLNHVKVNSDNLTVKFNKPVEINVGGILRAYCLARGYRMLKNKIVPKYPVELKLGGYVLSFGNRDWEYNVYDPFKDGKIMGKIHFNEGVVVSSSGRDHFVQIEGNLYSHILNLKTGYPIENFSNLIVYFENIEDTDFIPSVVLSLMGKNKAFGMLSEIKGSMGVWIDGSGQIFVSENKDSKAKWVKTKKMFSFLE